jgi:hypothetical protein
MFKLEPIQKYRNIEVYGVFKFINEVNTGWPEKTLSIATEMRIQIRFVSIPPRSPTASVKVT